MKIITVAKDENIYHAWPDVVLTQNGELICVFTECEHHNNRDNSRIMYTKSKDRGETWEAKKPLSEIKMKNEPIWNSARIVRTSDGSLIIISELMVNEKKRKEGEVFLWRGDKNGNKWDGPFPTGCKGYIPDKIIEVNTSHWILATQVVDHKKDNWEIYCYHSYNKGISWSEPVLAAKEKNLKLCEPNIVKIKDGTLVMLLRENSGNGLDCYKTFSKDGGKTWSELSNMPLPGCHRPVCSKLNNGLYMVSYRFSQGGEGWGKSWQNTFLAITDEESLLEPKRNKQWFRIYPLDYYRFISKKTFIKNIFSK